MLPARYRWVPYSIYSVAPARCANRPSQPARAGKLPPPATMPEPAGWEPGLCFVIEAASLTARTHNLLDLAHLADFLFVGGRGVNAR